MKTILSVALIAAVFAACNQKQASVATPAAASAPVAASAPSTLSGKVAETMSSGGYTYIRIDDKWAAVRETTVKVGDEVTIAPQMTLENFQSSTLHRTFDKIVFGELAGGGAPQAMGTPAQHMSGGAVAPGNVKTDRASGGKTVAELWAQKNNLADKTVTVRGTVVKFRPDIMGTNWMHIRDGSGSEAAGDFDLTVTTDEVAAAGDVVTVRGVLRSDKDFGAGYVYPVIVEKAKLTK